MNLFDQDGTIFDSQVFPEETIIKGCHNLVFNDCKFPNGVIIHVDRDSSSIQFHRTVASQMGVGYFREKGVLDGLLIDTAIASKFQIFYADTVSDPLIRRTKNIIWRNCESYKATYPAFQPTIADNPIIENCIGIGASSPHCNTFQINNCINPVIRGNVAGNTAATEVGDGCGIIIDWWKQNNALATTDALIEDNLCFGNKKGISNYRGIRSVIRGNRCVDNEIGLKFNQHNDYHAYKNSLLNNGTEVKFTNGATDAGYA